MFVGVAGGDADPVGGGWSAGIDHGCTTWVQFSFFSLGFKRLMSDVAVSALTLSFQGF